MTVYEMNLSTSEPNNHVGLIKIRQDDENSQVLRASITENNKVKNLEGFNLFLNARLPNNYIVRYPAIRVEETKNVVEITLIDSFWQVTGEVNAWFSFEKKVADPIDPELEIDVTDSTANFTYQVIDGPRRNIIQGNYIWEFEQIKLYWESIESMLGTDAATKLAMRILALEKEMIDYQKEVNEALEINFSTVKQTLLDFEKDYKAQIKAIDDKKTDKTTFNQEIESLKLKKADISYVDAVLQAIVSGAPTSTYNTLADLKKALPNGAKGVYLVLEDGHWYYWSVETRKWEDGGVYQSAVLGENAVKSRNVTNNIIHTIFIDTGTDFNLTTKKINLPSGHAINAKGWPSYAAQEIDIKYDGWNYVIFDLVTKKFSTTNTYYALQDDVILRGSVHTNSKTVYGFESYTIDGILPHVSKQQIQGTEAMVIGYSGDINYDFPNWKVEIPKQYYVMYVGGNRYFSKTEITKVDMVSNQEGILLYDAGTQKFRVSAPQYNYVPGIKEAHIAAYSRLDGGKVWQTGPYLINGYRPGDKEKVPGYAKTAINEMNEYLISNKKETNLNLIHLCDPHHFENSSQNGLPHIYAAVNLARMGQLDALVGNGDLVHDYSRSQTVKAMEDVREAFQTAKVPVYLTRGNHDINKVTDLPQISSVEFSNRVIYPMKQGNYNQRSDDGYYMVDFKEKKVRAVFLNATNDTTSVGSNVITWFGFDDRQLKWLASEALVLGDDKADWQVIVFGHTQLSANVYPSEIPRGAYGVQQNLDKFNLGEPYVNAGIGIDVTYTIANRLIAYAHGHTHCDYLKKPDGLSYWNVSTASSKPDYYDNPPVDNKSWERPLSTLQEDCWDIFMIDTENRKVRIKRYGAGQDRQFDY